MCVPAHPADPFRSTLAPIWELFAAYGSARVVASIARELGLAEADFLPRPLLPLDQAAQGRVRAALSVN